MGDHHDSVAGGNACKCNEPNQRSNGECSTCEHEGEKFGKEMIIRGSLERLVPVLMTALTAALALVPLTLDPQASGKEILYPVATVILGGLVSSTLLDMIVTPVVFYKFGEKALETYFKNKSAVDLDSK